MKKIYQWLGFAVVPLIGLVFTYFVIQNIQQKEVESKTNKLASVHNSAINELTKSIQRFAGVVSGMHSYMNQSENLPSASKFQKFVQQQLKDLKTTDSIVVSFIDTSHVFRHSFTRYHMDPSGLVGQTVASFRTEDKIDRLDKLMQIDDMQLFPPMNLFEGWVGLPLDFRVHRNGVTEGYVAPIIDFKTVMQNVYEADGVGDFVFHFITEEGHDFDRERVYNGTKVYNSNEDPEYYKNFVSDTTKFIYSKANYYGYELKIGTAYKDDHIEHSWLESFIWLCYTAFTLFLMIITWQSVRFNKLNNRLVKANELMEIRGKEIDLKNKDLHKLNQTKNKFFSIIGHDIRQPLHAIEGLLYLLEKEETQSSAQKELIRELADSTEKTANLLNNLLRWALSQTDEIKFNPTALDLEVLVSKTMETLEHQASMKEIKIIPNLKGDTTVMADHDMLRTILRNLISNAIKFSHKGGIIELNSFNELDFLRIEIRDHGIGMSENEALSLFDLDKQVSTIGTSGEIGTGLGLILCQEFVHKHNGTLEVVSNLNEGTCMIIKLPRA